MRSLSEGLRVCESEHNWAKPEGCSRKERGAKALRAESTASGGAGPALSAPGLVSQVSGSQGDGGRARAGLIRRYPAGRLPGGPGADPGADPGRGRRSGSRAGRKGTGLSSRLALRKLVTSAARLKRLHRVCLLPFLLLTRTAATTENAFTFRIVRDVKPSHTAQKNSIIQNNITTLRSVRRPGHNRTAKPETARAGDAVENAPLKALLWGVTRDSRSCLFHRGGAPARARHSAGHAACRFL